MCVCNFLTLLNHRRIFSHIFFCGSAHVRKNIVYTRYTHSVNASCSYKVQEDIICIHMNSLLEDVALL